MSTPYGCLYLCNYILTLHRLIFVIYYIVYIVGIRQNNESLFFTHPYYEQTSPLDVPSYAFGLPKAKALAQFVRSASFSSSLGIIYFSLTAK